MLLTVLKIDLVYRLSKYHHSMMLSYTLFLCVRTHFMTNFFEIKKSSATLAGISIHKKGYYHS